MRRLKLLLALAPVLTATVLTAGPAFPAGTTGANGLKLSAGARPEAMGGAFTGLADDLSALFWNPAGLANIRQPEGSFMHTSYLADTFYDSLAYAQPLGPLGTAAGAVNVLNYGTFRMTSARAADLMDSLSPADIFVTGAWGTAAPPFFGLDRLKAGASVKMTFQSLSTGMEGGLAVSGGALWDTPIEGLRAGTVLDNAGMVMSGGGMLPLSWRVGASYGRPIAPRCRGVATVDSLVQVDAGFRGGIGLEAVGYEIVALRAGWRGGGAEGGPTAGLGVRYRAALMDRPLLFKLDYAMASHGVLGVAHRVQLGLAVTGPAPSRAPAKAPEPAPIVAAPPPPPPPPLALSLTRNGTAARLAWENGVGPAYEAYATLPGAAEPMRLTATAIAGTFCVLPDLAPGEYAFRVVAVDPAKPGWTGQSAEARLVLPPPPSTVAIESIRTVQDRLGRVTFVKGKAELDPASTASLDEVVGLMARFPGLVLEIAGHTDSKGIPAKNLKLSQDRADAVARYLAGKGIDSSRLTTRGYGGAQPVADNSTEEGRSANRRVEFTATEPAPVTPPPAPPPVVPAPVAPSSTVTAEPGPAPVAPTSTVPVGPESAPAPVAPSSTVSAWPEPVPTPVAPSSTVSAEPAPSAPAVAKPVSLPKDPAEALKVVQDRAGRIAFVPGKAELDPSSAPTLDAVAKVLARNPKIRIEIAGHTDSVGSAANNQKVSQARAEAVVKYLAKKGVAGSRLVAKGYGGTKPVADNNTDTGRSANRRVEFSIIRSWF